MTKSWDWENLDGLSGAGTGLNLGLTPLDADGIQDVADSDMTEEQTADLPLDINDLDLTGIDLDSLIASGPPKSKPDRGVDTDTEADVSEGEEQEKARKAFLERLRPGRGGGPAVDTYVDHDESGDWDPKSDSHGSRTAPKKSSKDAEIRRAEEAERLERNIREWGETTKVCDKTRHTRCRFVFTIPVTNNKMEDTVAKIPDNWPNLACLKRPLLRATLWEDGISKKNLVDNDLRQTRGIGRERPEISVGDPQRNGCWGCYGKEECSLRQHDPIKWPCDACEDIGEECELIRSPVKKLSCTTCKAKKLRCTFADDPKADGPCQHCQQHGIRCSAGPTKDGLPTRYICEAPGRGPRPKIFSHDAQEETWGHCSYCQSLGTDCSLGAKEGEMPLTEKPPCKNCEFEGQDCDGIPIVQKARATKPKVTKPPIKNLPTKKQPIVKPRTSEPKITGPDITNTATTKQATTKPTHAKPSARKRKPATTFEEDESDAAEGATTVPAEPPTTPKSSPQKKAENNISSAASTTNTSDDGLFVSQTKNVEVQGGTEPPRKQRKITMIEAPKPIYLSEASRLFQPVYFHSEQSCAVCCSSLYAMLGKQAKTFVKHIQEYGGYEGTYLCGKCTDLRISILRCKQHTMVECGISEGRSFSTMLRELMADQSTRADPWCLLCSNPATHKCQVDGEGGEAHECGLILCGDCAKGMRRSKGVLATFIRDTPTTRTNTRPLGLRADVELLRDGEHLSVLALQK